MYNEIFTWKKICRLKNLVAPCDDVITTTPLIVPTLTIQGYQFHQQKNLIIKGIKFE
jgi:hypothetical protein